MKKDLKCYGYRSGCLCHMQHFKSISGFMISNIIPRHIMEGKDIVKSLGILYNFWNTYVIRYTYKCNLGRLNMSTYLTMLPMQFSILNKHN